MNLEDLMIHSTIIPDYHQSWKVEHKLSDILLLAICVVILGIEGKRYREFRSCSSGFFEALW